MSDVCQTYTTKIGGDKSDFIRLICKLWAMLSEKIIKTTL